VRGISELLGKQNGDHEVEKEGDGYQGEGVVSMGVRAARAWDQRIFSQNAA